MRFKLIGFIGLIGLIGSISPIYAQDTNHLFLHVDGSAFFIDNEYFGDRVSGYTLPGFVLQPKVEWRLGDDLALKGGFHWLNYWGARDYPATTAYGAYPLYDSVSRSMHLLPWLQVSVRFTSRLMLNFGSLDAGNHDLPLPLYNPELALVGDPETGIQLKYAGNWLRGDMWVDWREYIWDRSPLPERFTMGVSGSLLLDKEFWILYLPMHFVAQHEGGQNMSVSHNINNNFNAAAGVGFKRSLTEGYWFDLSCRALWYHQHGNAAVPFSSGWGFYPELQVVLPHWQVTASYWQGKDFVPLLGSWHFSNLSANTPGLTFDRTRVVTLRARWTWPSNQEKPYVLNIYGDLYHYLPSTGTYADGTTNDYGHRNQVAFGAVLSFSPTVKLH